MLATRAHRAELELVPRERERARPVPVARMPRQLRQRRAPRGPACRRACVRLGSPCSTCARMSDSIVAQEDRDDGRRRLVGTEPVIVGRRRDRSAQQVGVQVHRPHHRHQEHQELQVGVGLVLRIEQVDARVGGHRPVVVLARAVDAGERLLVQQRGQAVPLRHPLDRLHRQHLVVAGDVALLEQRRDLVLPRRHLVVPRLDRHAQPPQLPLHLVPCTPAPAPGSCRSTGPPAAAPSGGRDPNRVRSHDTRSGRAKNRSRSIRKYSCSGPTVVNTCDTPSSVPNILRMRQRLLGQRLHRAEQRDLGVERLAGPRHEGGRNAEGDGAALAPDQERRTGRVPGRVAAGLERRAQARPTGSSRHPARPAPGRSRRS